MLVIVPIEEQDACWFYYRTRSPFQLDSISSTLYELAIFSRFSISVVEAGILIWFAH
jgi:hypothetical protein